MKNRPMLALIALGLLVAAPRGLGGTATKAEALINHARSVLTTPGFSHDAVTGALAEALEASFLIMPKTDYADEFRSRVEVAKKMFEKKDLSSDKLLQYLELAYKLVSGGKAWQLPEELNKAYQLRPDLAHVTQICQKLLDSALTEHKAGRDVESVRCLLEFVILVITPFEACGAMAVEAGHGGSALICRPAWTTLSPIEAAARNAWILGVLGSALNFTIALSDENGGIAAASSRMTQSFIVTLYGLVMAVVCLIPVMKLAGQGEKAPAAGRSGPGPARPIPLERALGYILFAAVLGLTIFSLVRDSPQSGPLPVAKVLLHFPAALVVFGGAISLALFMGAGSGARALTLGFAVTGVISLLMGLIQAMFGFAHRNVGEIAAAVAFIISASSFALFGLAVIAAPLEDREVMDGRRERPGSLSRMFWTVFPLLAFIFMLLAFIMVVTPVRAGLMMIPVPAAMS